LSKIVLIDGHSVLNRAYYGLPALTNRDGVPTGAVYGFLTMMFKILDEEKPDNLIVTFDVHAPTFRHKMYDAYKGTRKPMDPELREQVDLIHEVLTSMGIFILEQAGLEADDLIGTLSVSCEEKGMDVVVFSGDRDLLQLATEKVEIRIPKTKMGGTTVENYFANDVFNRYQVTPKEFIDLKALMGDTADNIPGVKGIGEKTATKIITSFHSIENAYENINQINPARVANLLQMDYENAVLSKKLATIELHADIDVNLDSSKLGNIYTKSAYEVFENLGFKKLLPRFATKEQVNESTTDVFPFFDEVKGKESINAFFEKIKEVSEIGFSFYFDEMSDLPLFTGQVSLRGVAISYKLDNVIKASLLIEDDTFDIEEILGKLEDLYEKVSKIYAFNIKEMLDYVVGNLEFHLQKNKDEKKSINVGYEITATVDAKELIVTLFEKNSSKFRDIMIMDYLLDPLRSEYILSDIALNRLRKVNSKEKDERANACFKAYVSLDASKGYIEDIRNAGMEDLYNSIEMPLVFSLFEMEKNGVRVNKDALERLSREFEKQIFVLENQIYEDAGQIFNINSPKQLGEILFDKMGIQGGKKNKTGYSTSADVLEKLAPENPIVSKVLEYRGLSKLNSTYAIGLTAFIKPDGRIHGQFNQTVTATGRISSSDPNLQNIPVRTDMGREIRKVFEAKYGFTFIDADYSQIELRILAHFSGDEHLIEAYKEEKDIHAITASKVFHVPISEVTPVLRRNAKAVNFGIVYGISAFGLSNDLSISRNEATRYINDYFKTYPGIKKFLDEQVSNAKDLGYVTTLFGRRRPVPEITASNFHQRSFGERVAMNAPIQGSAADIMKIAMNGVYRRLQNEKLQSRLVLQIHDEILVETMFGEEEIVKKIITEEMTNAADLKVPLIIDLNEGSTWYEAH
jgi:DNA polymerase-1